MVHSPTEMERSRAVKDYMRWFASQGGKARKRALTPEQLRASAQKAGRARWRGTTAEQRREAARKAIQARWAKHRKRP